MKLGFFDPLYVEMSRRFWFGTSQQHNFTTVATRKNSAAGTSIASRQDKSSLMPMDRIGSTRAHMMKICVTPPPRLPQPAAVAFAVPTTFGANMSEHQNWFVTKVAPAQPMRNRRIEYIHFPLIIDERATMLPPNVSNKHCTFTGPITSSPVPRMMRTKTVEPTDAMPAFAIVFLHSVPLPQTHFTAFRVSKSYLVVFAKVHSSLSASSPQASISDSAGISAQSFPSSVFPCTQKAFPVLMFLYPMNAGLVGFSSMTNIWFSHSPIL